MNITKEWLQDKCVCSEGMQWFLSQSETNLQKVVRKLIKESQLDWANWTVSRVMDTKQCVQYAVYAAKQVLNLFEKDNPEDMRPRNAIKAAMRYLKTSNTTGLRDATHATHAAAVNAATRAAHAADSADAATHATYAANAAAHAAHATYAAYAATYAAAHAAAHAANAATHAADAATHAADAAAVNAATHAATHAARTEMKTRIIVYGLRLLAGGSR